MHDPSTLAIEIKYPWKRKTSHGEYRDSIVDIWHIDPCKDGSDDSCGWFMRARHGDQKVLERIIKRYEFDWDRIFISENSGTIYHSGFFKPSGDPHFSVQGIVLNLFFLAACEYFNADGRTNWGKARKWMRKHLFDILIFAENPTDSLFDGITRKFEIGCGEVHDTRRRKERIERMAATTYGWILREERPWYKHPRWHVRHWEIKVLPLQAFKRWAFSRCYKCGKGFSWGYCPVSDGWGGEGPKWFRSEKGIYHSDYGNPTSESCAVKTPTPKGE